jgi:hypothetical protein
MTLGRILDMGIVTGTMTHRVCKFSDCEMKDYFICVVEREKFENESSIVSFSLEGIASTSWAEPRTHSLIKGGPDTMELLRSGDVSYTN